MVTNNNNVENGRFPGRDLLKCAGNSILDSSSDAVHYLFIREALKSLHIGTIDKFTARIFAVCLRLVQIGVKKDENCVPAMQNHRGCVDSRPPYEFELLTNDLTLFFGSKVFLRLQIMVSHEKIHWSAVSGGEVCKTLKP